MLNQERRREERRERVEDDPSDQSTEGGGTGVDYYAVVDNLINSAISSDSEAFNQQMVQANGQ